MSQGFSRIATAAIGDAVKSLLNSYQKTVGHPKELLLAVREMYSMVWLM